MEGPFDFRPSFWDEWEIIPPSHDPYHEPRGWGLPAAAEVEDILERLNPVAWNQNIETNEEWQDSIARWLNKSHLQNMRQHSTYRMEDAPLRLSPIVEEREDGSILEDWSLREWAHPSYPDMTFHNTYYPAVEPADYFFDELSGAQYLADFDELPGDED